MAIGPIARILAQTVVMGIGILARALPAAYGAALQNAKRSGAEAAVKSGSESILGKRKMAVDEALQVLNIPDTQDVTLDRVQQVCFVSVFF
jgi:import inner membrane translocase subunit TIM16